MISYNKALTNIKAYLPDDTEIINIIKYCQLTNDENNWKIWYDNLGNKLDFSVKNKIIITPDNKKNIKDIHYKLHPRIFMKRGQYLLIHKNKEFIYCLFLFNNCCYLCTLYNNIWQENSAPINIGLENIRTLIKNMDIKKHKEIDDNTIVIKLPSSDINNIHYKAIIESFK